MDIKENLVLTISCAVADGRATDAEESEFHAYIDELEADAQRLRGLRLLLCETDKTLQETMGEAIETYMDANGLSDITQLTPELLDSLIDGLLAAAATARAKVTG